MKTTCRLITAAFVAFALSSCDKPQTETASSAQATAPAPALAKFFTDEGMADAVAIHVARTTAKPGDEITLKGEVMGRETVFTEGRASFILGDPEKLTPCNKIPGDTCETPWDACCDSSELKLIGLASIQIVGADGRVLEGNLKGTNGIKELSSITVTGTVAPQSTPEALIVNATKIHVEKP
jgi:hypothetical protein